MAERIYGDPRIIIPPLLQQGRLFHRFPRVTLKLETIDTEEFAGVRIVRKIGVSEEDLGIWGLDRMNEEPIEITRRERDTVVGMSRCVVRPFWDRLEKKKP